MVVSQVFFDHKGLGEETLIFAQLKEFLLKIADQSLEVAQLFHQQLNDLLEGKGVAEEGVFLKYQIEVAEVQVLP